MQSHFRTSSAETPGGRLAFCWAGAVTRCRYQQQSHAWKARDVEDPSVLLLPTVDRTQINNISCDQTDNTSCSGFLETWLIGTFQHIYIRDSIVEDTVEDLITEIIGFTDGTALPTTINDLTTIRDYMNVNPDKNLYRQICDLEGFFLQGGGFIVIDAPRDADNVTLDYVCDEGDPTTQQVLSALNSMIMSFQDSANSAPLMTASIWMLFLHILIVAIF